MALVVVAVTVQATNILWTENALYVADTFNNAIRKLDPSMRSRVSTVAGGNGRGFRDGPGSAALFFWPRGLAAHEGTLYVTEEGNRAIRTVNLATRDVGTLSLPYSSAMLRAFAPGNAVCLHRNRFLLVGGNWGIGSIDLRAKPLAGALVTDRVKRPGGLVCDGPDIFVTSHETNGVHQLAGRDDTSFMRTLRTYRSSAGVTATELAQCDGSSLGLHGRPQGLTLTRRWEPPGSLFLTDYDGGRIVRLELGGCPPGSVANGVRLSVFVGRQGVAVESGALSATAQLAYPRGITISSRGSATLYVSDSGQTVKAIDLRQTVPVVSTLAGQHGCGYQNGPGYQARFWLARGCPFHPTPGEPGGGDGDSAGCTIANGCPTRLEPGKVQWFTIHALSRSGSSWLGDLLDHAQGVFMHSECYNLTTTGSWMRQLVAAHAGLDPGAVGCSYELLRNNPGDWPAVKAALDAFRRRALFAYPRPIAAGIKVIDDNRDFMSLLPNWTKYWSRWPMLNIVLVRRGCLAQYVSEHHIHSGSHGKEQQAANAKVLASQKLLIEEEQLQKYCLMRNAIYRRLLKQLPSVYLIEYESLTRNPTAVVAPLLKRLRIPANLSADLFESHSKFHTGAIETYLRNPEQVRAMRAERFDFDKFHPFRRATAEEAKLESLLRRRLLW